MKKKHQRNIKQITMLLIDKHPEKIHAHDICFRLNLLPKYLMYLVCSFPDEFRYIEIDNYGHPKKPKLYWIKNENVIPAMESIFSS